MPFASTGMMGWLPFSGLGLAGMLFNGRKQKLTAKGRKWILGVGAALLLSLSLFALGCGYNSGQQVKTGNVTMMVIGTSGAIVHSVPVTLNVH